MRDTDSEKSLKSNQTEQETLLTEDTRWHELITASIATLSKAEHASLIEHLKSHFSHPGLGKTFLSGSEANLLTRMKEDWDILNKLGTSPQAVGERLYQIIFPDLEINQRGRRRLRTENNVPEHITVTLKENHEDWTRCPFIKYNLCDDSAFAARDQRVSICHPYDELLGSHLFRIENSHNNISVEVSGLICHLAADHSFFPGDSNRVDPTDLAKVIELI